MNLFKRKKSPESDLRSISSASSKEANPSKLKAFLKKPPKKENGAKPGHGNEGQKNEGQKQGNNTLGTSKSSGGKPSNFGFPTGKSEGIPGKSEGNSEGKRISTVVEDESIDDYEDPQSDANSTEIESTDSDESYQPHDHVFLPREKTASVSQLSHLMGYWGLSSAPSRDTLRKAADEESRRTFSLLTAELKILRLSATMNRSDSRLHESIIQEHQARLISELSGQLRRVLDYGKATDGQYACLEGHKSLYDRYGTVHDVVGRGTYGVIKLIQPHGGGGVVGPLYAVKEMAKRQAEPRDKFIERIISEFVVLSSLNNHNIVKTIDLMVTLPPHESHVDDGIKINQVMESSVGGDLFSYLKNLVTNHEYLSIDEIDCMVKQLAKGLWYMHSHGVAHCDMKLENVLILYVSDGGANYGNCGGDNKLNSVNSGDNANAPGQRRLRLVLKISDFGKASVFRTMWDSKEQLHSTAGGGIGSEPYLAPEEHVTGDISLAKKDCWALGIIILSLYNLRRSVICGANGGYVQLRYFDQEAHEEDTRAYGICYLWRRTDLKSGPVRGNRYRDEIFDEYVKTAMVADYEPDTKEWNIQREGSFLPIETLFDTENTKVSPDQLQLDEGFDEDNFAIRKFFIYQLLAVNARRRVDMEELLRGDWLGGVETC